MENYQAFLKNLTQSELLKEAYHVVDTKGEKYSKENLIELIHELQQLGIAFYYLKK